MKRDTLIDDRQRKSRVQSKVPERPSVRPSVHLELSPLLMVRITPYFFHDFYIFCWKSLTREHKTEFLSLIVYELQALQRKGLTFLLIFAFFVENHLLGNTKLSFLVLWFQSYRPCVRRQGKVFSCVVGRVKCSPVFQEWTSVRRQSEVYSYVAGINQRA